MNTSKTFPVKSTLFISSIILFFVCATLRTLSMAFFFDTSAGYFFHGAVLPIISDIALIISVISTAILSFLSFKKSESLVAQPSTSILNVSSSILIAASLVILCISDFMFQAGPLAIALDIISAVYFAICVFKVNAFAKVGTGFIFIVRLALLIYKTHFNWSSPTNAPEKLLFLIACGFTVIFISQELKCFSDTAKPAFYVFSAVSTAIIGLSASLPVIISSYCKILSNENSIYAEFYVLLAISLYASIRALTVFKSINCNDNN